MKRNATKKQEPKPEEERPITASDAFMAAARQAKLRAAELYLDREDTAADAMRNLATLLNLCAQYPGDAVKLGCDHIRKNSKMLQGQSL